MAGERYGDQLDRYQRVAQVRDTEISWIDVRGWLRAGTSRAVGNTVVKFWFHRVREVFCVGEKFIFSMTVYHVAYDTSCYVVSC